MTYAILPDSLRDAARALAGKGYGTIPASNPIGPEGGRALAEKSLEIIKGIWK